MDALNQNKSKKFATGWLIVVACMLIQAIPFGVASNIQPQFVSYIVDGALVLASIGMSKLNKERIANLTSNSTKEVI